MMDKSVSNFAVFRVFARLCHLVHAGTRKTAKKKIRHSILAITYINWLKIFLVLNWRFRFFIFNFDCFKNLGFVNLFQAEALVFRGFYCIGIFAINTAVFTNPNQPADPKKSLLRANFPLFFETFYPKACNNFLIPPGCFSGCFNNVFSV